ncbi:MAG: hypothetical protein HOK41_05245 [Nitrospina sp.]|jgi:hypothetical protein|nr:hypothetical protein [Nitrospina sp.]MBT6717502.1 hypothetical protein [Nitrospina sp.]
MKLHKPLLVFFLIPTLLLGLLSGCSTTREKKLEAKGLTLMYKSKSAAGHDLADIRLKPVQLSEGQVRQQMRSLKYEELSLFGKKKLVFMPQDITRMTRILTKALNRAPANKIVYYELETPGGSTEGIVFPSKKVLNWKFSTIQGGSFSSRSFTGWGGSNWRLVPGPGQHYHSTKKLLGSEASENWIEASLSQPRYSERNNPAYQEPAPTRTKRKARRATRAPTRKQAPSPPTINPELEKKLQFLKDLYEKNLVDEDEYNSKRKELLDTYL